MRANSKRNVFLLAGVAVIIVGLIFFSAQKPSIVMKSNYTLPGIFQSAIAYDNNSLVVANGRSFVRYDYHSGKTSQLSKDGITPDTTGLQNIELSANKRFITFYEPEIDPGSTEEYILNQSNLDTSVPYWWVFDTSSQTYKPFPGSTLAVHLNGENAYALIQNGERKQIITYSMPDLQQTESIGVPETEDFTISQSGFLLQTPQSEKLLLTKDGVVNQQLYSDASIVGTLQNSRYVVATRSQNRSQDLLLLDLQEKSQKTLATNVQGDIEINGNSILYSRSANGDSQAKYKPYIFNQTTGKTNALTFEVKYLQDASLTPVALLDDTTAIVANNSSQAYLVSAGTLNPLASPAKDYEKIVSVEGQQVELGYYPDETAFLVTLETAAAQAQAQAVYNQLAKDGYNPALTDIRFTLFTTPQLAPAPTTTTPATDTPSDNEGQFAE